MNLRPYQTRAIDALRAEYASGRRAPIAVLPTGAGKTVIAAEIIRASVARGRRVLFLAHRAELITQSVSKLESAGVTDLRIIQAAADLGSHTAPVAVASIPTLTKWATMPDADLVIFDECHHTVARTWARIAQNYSSALLLGLTATPQRGDGKGLGDVFDALVVGSTVRELTDLGHLVPCRAYAPASILDAAQIVLTPVAAYLNHTPDERAVVFCATVDHAQRVADEFTAAGISAAMVDGALSADVRRGRLAAFAAGGIKVVTNVHVLTEGWDCPAASVCILARKPQHDGTFLQMVGRVLRPSPGKRHATLIDLCGSVHDHGTPDMEREFTLDGRGIKKVDRDAIRQCVACGGVFLAGPAQCPLCGHQAPRREVRLPEAIGGELVDLNTLPKLPPRSFTVSITAKYPGRCRMCAGRIAPGEQIYWAKGEKPRHAECPRATGVVA